MSLLCSVSTTKLRLFGQPQVVPELRFSCSVQLQHTSAKSMLSQVICVLSAAPDCVLCCTEKFVSNGVTSNWLQDA